MISSIALGGAQLGQALDGVLLVSTSPPTSLRMRASPKAFFLGKAMNLKGTKSAHVEFNSEGKIVIEQWSDDLEQPVTIYLTYDQFVAIESWLFRNREDISLAWNNGVENEPQA
jgi:hypothetical protein